MPNFFIFYNTSLRHNLKLYLLVRFRYKGFQSNRTRINSKMGAWEAVLFIDSPKGGI